MSKYAICISHLVVTSMFQLINKEKLQNETGIKSSSVYNLAGNYRSSPSRFSGTKVFQRPGQRGTINIIYNCAFTVLTHY